MLSHYVFLILLFLNKNNLVKTGIFRCFGEVRFWNGLAEMIHPEYRRIQNENFEHLEKH